MTDQPAHHETGASAAPTLSVAVPVFMEEEGIGEFHRRLTGVLEGLDNIESWEIVYVDDGSRDSTPLLLRSFADADPRVRVLTFSRNFGHQPAITAAMEFAAGEAIVVIDSDLQDPPEVIQEMIDAWRNGAQVVYGQRRQRAGESVFKKATASIFYRLLRWLSEVDIPRNVGDFRLIDRRVADVLQSMPERSRYVRGMVSWVGFTQVPVVYDRDPRFAGTTKYPFRRMLKFALDATTSFSDKPLRLASRLGALFLFLAIGGSTYLLASELFFDSATAPGWASIMVVVLLFGAVQLLSIGLLGEYIGRIFRQVQFRPNYIVKDDTQAARRPRHDVSTVATNDKEPSK
jgi:dolichol-phosphate mannosyltransferase